MKKIFALIFLWLCTSHLFAAPLKVDFVAQIWAKFDLRGGVDFTNLEPLQLTTVSIVFDPLAGIQYSWSAPGQYHYVVSSAHFNDIKYVAPISYDYFMFDNETHNIQFYFNEILNSKYSDVLSMSLVIRPDLDLSKDFDWTSLRTTDLDRTYFDYLRTDISTPQASTTAYVGSIRSLSISNVPEPNAIFLLVFGFICLVWTRKRSTGTDFF
jgi:hypothetical protein